jgi:hypothetical protein
MSAWSRGPSGRVRDGSVGWKAGQDPLLAERLPLVGVAVQLDEVARARIHRQLRLHWEVPVVPLDELVHPREAPRLRGLPPAARELVRVGDLDRKLAPRVVELGLVPVELVLDRPEPSHPDRGALDRADRRACVGSEVAEPLPERLPFDRAPGEVLREHATLSTVPRRLGQDRALAHDFPGFPGIHGG